MVKKLTSPYVLCKILNFQTRIPEKVFIPAFSVTCIAAIFRHPSFDMLSKQDGSESTNHSPLAWPFELVAHLHRSDMNQTLACIGCDWLISNSTSKDDVVRWMSIHVTLKAGVIDRAQSCSDSLSFPVLSIFKIVIFVTRSKTEPLMLMRQIL